MSNSSVILILSMCVLGAYLLLHYILRIRIAYRPQSLFANIAPAVGKMWQQCINSFKTNGGSINDDGTPENIINQKKQIENLKNLYFNNLFWSYLATKLQLAVSSRPTDLYFVAALVYTFLLTVGVFALEYWACLESIN